MPERKFGVCGLVNWWKIKKAGEKVDQKELKKLSPLIKKISKDRSRCLSCGHELKWYDLIPVVSWVAGLGRCRYCKAFIGWTEILLELVMAGLFVASVAFLAWIIDGYLASRVVGLVVGKFGIAGDFICL